MLKRLVDDNVLVMDCGALTSIDILSLLQRARLQGFEAAYQRSKNRAVLQGANLKIRSCAGFDSAVKILADVLGGERELNTFVSINLEGAAPGLWHIDIFSSSAVTHRIILYAAHTSGPWRPRARGVGPPSGGAWRGGRRGARRSGTCRRPLTNRPACHARICCCRPTDVRKR